MNRLKTVFSILLTSLMLMSCASTQKLQYTRFEGFTDKSSGLQKDEPLYIYIRLYAPDFKDGQFIYKVFKTMIETTDVNEIKATHAAIGFNLKDCFVGFTSTNIQGYYLNLEECTNPSSHPYMLAADPQKSYQYTYALKVTPREYKKAMRIVNKYLKRRDAVYAGGYNFAVAFRSIGRKFLTPKERQCLECQSTGYCEVDETQEPDGFICSAFVSYVLIKSVPVIKKYFKDNNLDYRLITPSDIPAFPGVKEVYRSTYSDCDYSKVIFP